MNEFIEKLITILDEEFECYPMVGISERIRQLAEEYKDKSNIIYDLKAFLKEKFKYNSEQAEIWRDGSDNDEYFRQQKDLYMDRANIYGEVMREIDRLAEEHNGGWIPCSERLPKEVGYYLVTDSNGDIILATYNINFVGWAIDYYGNIDAIAWQPLPEPYKKEGAE